MKDDMVSRQRVRSMIASWNYHLDDLIDLFKALDEVDELPSEKIIEPLTDIEQRIFLAAISREEKVCEKVDEELTFPKAENYIDLVPVCRSIERKVKKALWG